MNSLAGSEPPTPDQLRNLGPSRFLESRSVFGKKLINESMEISFKLEGLQMQTSYDFYILVEGRDP